VSVRAFLGLGSNMGDRQAFLRDAVATLGDAVTGVSPVYETEAMGGPSQGAYLNVVVELDTDLPPRELLGLCHRLEGAADRVRTVRWGPRTLDVDILWIEGCTIDQADLQIPHPRMAERRFVMAPLADLAPDVVPPDWAEHAEGRVTKIGAL
jgi:2-amino-4-hydroxy-6-hydroxymethyldihydropteridine diphosphokinase